MSANYDTEARLRAIAANAVREAMLVYGRWDQPFLDDDAARMETIFSLLHLQQAMTSQESEHAPLTIAGQKPITAALPKIADLLEKTETTGRIEPRPALSIAKNKPVEFA